MLSTLEIQNFGIIEHSRMEFQKGFHALSGETGAGKSILFEALNFVLGARADGDLLRAGTQEAMVSAVFEGAMPPELLETLAEVGVVLEAATDLLILRRNLNAQGRSKGFINDIPVTLKTLNQVGGYCVQYVGQGAGRELTETHFLYRILDQYGDHFHLLESYTEAYETYQQRREELQTLQDRIEAAQDQEEFLRFQARELEEAKVRAGESEELEQLKARLKHRVTLAGLTFEMLQALSESEEPLLDNLAKVGQIAQKAFKLDSGLQDFLTAFEEGLNQLEGAAQKLKAYGNDLEEEPESLDPIESRLALLSELKRKYRLDEAGLVEKWTQIKTQLSELEDYSSLLAEKTQALKEAEGLLQAAAKKLNQARVRAGEVLNKKIGQSLKSLALSHTEMHWDLKLKDRFEDYHRLGGEDLTFLVSFNPGEEMRPFHEVLSGGELSRLLLALYDVMFPAKGHVTLLFDEVDAGVGGRVAELMGRMLKNLSHKTQVLCITHLPQIASLADWQYVVLKEVSQGRTFSRIHRLSSEERVEEIARMLAGVEITKQALVHAKALLKNSAA